jgi:single-stranded DNA-binding protein
VNKVLLSRLTSDPEMRSLSSGKAVTQFWVVTNEYFGDGKEKAEYQSIVRVYPCRRVPWSPQPTRVQPMGQPA